MYQIRCIVLILVLVEHTLRESAPKQRNALTCLNPCFSGTYSQSGKHLWHTVQGDGVLILVLVEHTLRAISNRPACPYHSCLNPCFSGTYSQRANLVQQCASLARLNPCFSGTYSQRDKFLTIERWSEVLILVLVEHTLRGRGCQEGSWS